MTNADFRGRATRSSSVMQSSFEVVYFDLRRPENFYDTKETLQNLKTNVQYFFKKNNRTVLFFYPNINSCCTCNATNNISMLIWNIAFMIYKRFMRATVRTWNCFFSNSLLDWHLLFMGCHQCEASNGGNDCDKASSTNRKTWLETASSRSKNTIPSFVLWNL